MADKIIDNDFHPDDKGLNASQEDHWGTKLNTMIQEENSRSYQGMPSIPRKEMRSTYPDQRERGYRQPE